MPGKGAVEDRAGGVMAMKPAKKENRELEGFTRWD